MLLDSADFAAIRQNTSTQRKQVYPDASDARSCAASLYEDGIWRCLILIWAARQVPTSPRYESVMLHRHCLFALVLTFTAAAASAEDWPAFRGPQRNGHSKATGLPTHWTQTENVTWKQAIPGLGWSSPVVADGRLCLTTAVPVDGTEEDHALTALILDAKTGNTLQSVELFRQLGATAPGIHTKNSHASPTPIIDGDRIYVHFGHQGTACLTTAGEIVWRNDTLRYRPVHGNGGSPALVGDHIIFSCDGAADPFIVALNKNTGDVVWRRERDTDAFKKFSFNTPLHIDVAGQSQLISLGSNRVRSYDPETGNEIWFASYDGYSVIPRPVAGHGMVFIATGYDRPSVMAIRVDGQGDVNDSHVAWTVTRAAPHTPSLLLVDDLLFMVSDSGILTCLDALMGEQVWQERIGGRYSASPVYAEGSIYLQNEAGDGLVVAAGREFRQVAENTVGERTLASYAIADGAIFVRGESHLFRIEKQ